MRLCHRARPSMFVLSAKAVAGANYGQILFAVGTFTSKAASSVKAVVSRTEEGPRACPRFLDEQIRLCASSCRAGLRQIPMACC